MSTSLMLGLKGNPNRTHSKHCCTKHNFHTVELYLFWHGKILSLDSKGKQNKINSHASLSIDHDTYISENIPAVGKNVMEHEAN